MVDPVALGVGGEIEDVVDLFEEKPLILERPEPPLAGAVLAGRTDAGADVRSSGWWR